MDPKLKNAIIAAAKNNIKHIRAHIERPIPKEKNKHNHINDFQKAVNKDLNTIFNKLGYKEIWEPEQKKNGQKFKDSIDILGKIPGRNCIIEIDAVRHDQIAAKFVSRLALWGLDDEPIDYVAILYDSTQESGLQAAQKYVQYMYDILKKINPKSSLIGIYVDTPLEDSSKNEVSIWNFEGQLFSIGSKTYDDMNKCARAAIELYINRHPDITFADLHDQFARTRRHASYIFAEEGGSRAKKINLQTADGKDVYVYSQFRASNWKQFVKVCNDNGIVIE